LGTSRHSSDHASCDHGHEHDGASHHHHRGGGRLVAAPDQLEARRADRRRLIVALSLTGVIAVAEAVGGWMSGSLALLSDAGHMLTDLSAIALSLLALYFSARPANVKKTYGYYRAEILSALANGMLLFGITVVILLEAYHRFQEPTPLKTEIAATVAAIGLVANLIALGFLHRSHSMNVRGAFLHVLGDTLSSVGVLAGLGIYWFTGWTAIDPIVSAVISLIIVVSAVRLVRDAVDVLLEATPSHVDLDAVRKLMGEVSGVTAVHDLHVWTISSGIYALSVHLVVTEAALPDNHRILTAVKHQLFDQFGIDHTTIQIEPEGYAHLGEVH
jgi:cobalt-zinc-cadmium efflux system protein